MRSCRVHFGARFHSNYISKGCRQPNRYWHGDSEWWLSSNGVQRFFSDGSDVMQDDTECPSGREKNTMNWMTFLERFHTTKEASFSRMMSHRTIVELLLTNRRHCRAFAFVFGFMISTLNSPIWIGTAPLLSAAVSSLKSILTSFCPLFCAECQVYIVASAAFSFLFPP